ncbi:MAG: hypothetical protein EBY29_16275, partial [Planctomycetes bacterium]|nr:hypothetical protein [Planctomycetota bacterium]
PPGARLYARYLAGFPLRVGGAGFTSLARVAPAAYAAAVASSADFIRQAYAPNFWERAPMAPLAAPGALADLAFVPDDILIPQPDPTPEGGGRPLLDLRDAVARLREDGLSGLTTLFVLGQGHARSLQAVLSRPLHDAAAAAFATQLRVELQIDSPFAPAALHALSTLLSHKGVSAPYNVRPTSYGSLPDAAAQFALRVRLGLPLVSGTTVCAGCFRPPDSVWTSGPRKGLSNACSITVGPYTSHQYACKKVAATATRHRLLADWLRSLAYKCHPSYSISADPKEPLMRQYFPMLPGAKPGKRGDVLFIGDSLPIIIDIVVSRINDGELLETALSRIHATKMKQYTGFDVRVGFIAGAITPGGAVHPALRTFVDVLAAATVAKHADKDLMAVNLARQRAW